MSADPFAPPVAALRPSRLWPSEPNTAASPAVLASALSVGVLAALTLSPQLAGSANLLAGVGILAVALGGRTSRITRPQVGAVALTVALLGVAVMRSAPWLLVLCLLGACVVGTLALVGGRTWTGLAIGALAGGLATPRAIRWVQRTLAQIRLPGLRSRRVWLVVAVTAALVALFGALFATADPAYAALLDRAVPAVNVPKFVQRFLVLGAVTTAAILAAFLAHEPPCTDALAPPPGRPVRRWEWAAPLVVLDLLFLSFVLVQLTVLFGGRAHVLATEGLTYAEYARQGFWQLLVVTVLTLVVIAIAVRTAPRATPSDLLIVRLLLALLCVLALVVVVSAIHRMSLYEQEYGFTRLRIFVDAVELALGATFILLLAAGVRLTNTWLPRAVVALAAGALLLLATVNPDAYIASHNVTRYEETRRIDLAYLSTLSADAVPALDRLPADLRSCALQRLAAEFRDGSDPWFDFNIARGRARRLLSSHPITVCQAAEAGRTPGGLRDSIRDVPRVATPSLTSENRCYSQNPQGGPMTAVALETTQAVELMERVETLESVARSLPEQDERRQRLLALVERDLSSAAPLRPRVAAELLGMSEKTIRTWVEEGVLQAAETSSPRLLLEVARVHLVLHLIEDLRAAGRTKGLLDEVYRRLVDASRLERDDLRESLGQMRRGEGRVIATARSNAS